MSWHDLNVNFQSGDNNWSYIAVKSSESLVNGALSLDPLYHKTAHVFCGH